MKKQTIPLETIQEATITYVAEYGLENVTTKKVALSLGISEGTIFYHFPNKKALLTACLYYIDSQIDQALKTVPFRGLNISKNIRNMWYTYFSYLVTHSSYTKFYRQFRQSSYYSREVMAGQNQSFSFFVKVIQKNAQYFGFNPEFYWVFIIETTLTFAIRVADGDLPGTPKDIDRIYSLISHGFIGNLDIKKRGPKP